MKLNSGNVVERSCSITGSFIVKAGSEEFNYLSHAHLNRSHLTGVFDDLGYSGAVKVVEMFNFADSDGAFTEFKMVNVSDSGNSGGNFVVWIDTNGGLDQPDWEINSEPKTLAEAIEETRGCHKSKFPTAILPEGVTPREDGFFSNPETDP